MPTAIAHAPPFTVPGSSTSTALVRWNGTGGNQIQDSTILVGATTMGLAADTDLVTFSNGTLTIAGTVAATTLTGAGAGITALAAANITASGTLPALNGAALTALTAANITASGTLPALNGAALTALNGTQVTSGTLPAARIAADSIVEAKLDVSNGPTNGQFLQAQSGEGGGLTWAAASAGAVTREGGNTTEATTTSFTAVDLLSITSLTPDITENLICIAQIRNTAPGAGANCAMGLKINSTIIMEADITRSSFAQVGVLWATGTDTVARAGSSFLLLGPQVTNYLAGVQSGYTSNQVSGGASAQSQWSRAQNFSADMPAAAVTSVIYRGEGEDVTNPDPTLGIDEVHVYSLVAS